MSDAPAPSPVRGGNPLTPAGRRILEVASGLFYLRGINSVGMELVAAEAGVTKKTVYDRFGSKESLVAAYLHARDQRWRALVTERMEDVAGAEPGARILATFDALAEWTATENERGCAMVNAHAELADPGHAGRAVAEAQKAWLRELYVGLARAAGGPEPERLADTLLILHEGALVAVSAAGVPDAVATARAAAARLLAPA